MNDRAERLLMALSDWQHLRPHRALKDVLVEASAKLGLCHVAAERAVAWLEVDDTQAIGRLRATELMQLARCLQRMWDQTNPTSPRRLAPAPAQP